MKHPWATVLVLGTLGGLGVTAVPCVAQMLSPPSGSQTQPPSIPGLTVPGLQGPVAQPGSTQTPILAPDVIQGSSPGMSFGLAPGSVGQGLPGMPGGPPVNAPMGARSLRQLHETSGDQFRTARAAWAERGHRPIGRALRSGLERLRVHEVAPRSTFSWCSVWCRSPGSNRDEPCGSRDFKSLASACSATPAQPGGDSSIPAYRRVKVDRERAAQRDRRRTEAEDRAESGRSRIRGPADCGKAETACAGRVAGRSNSRSGTFGHAASITRLTAFFSTSALPRSIARSSPCFTLRPSFVASNRARLA